MINLVAVYGSLKKGYGNHRLLENAEYLGTTDTAPDWTMYSLGGFPAIVPDGDTQICIEVYNVTQREFQSLDMLEGYPSFYNRRVIDTRFGKAWIYFMENKHDDYFNEDRVVEHGVW